MSEIILQIKIEIDVCKLDELLEKLSNFKCGKFLEVKTLEGNYDLGFFNFFEETKENENTY